MLPPTFSIGQHADCDKMVHLKGSTYKSGPISGFGDIQESFNNELDKGVKECRILDKEKNSIWYLITIPDSGIFTFDIIPTQPKHDWDFILFEHKKKFCKRIEAKKIQPIRSNLSRSAQTGIASGYRHQFVGEGINENYSRAITANKGDQYVLVVNNPKQVGKSHTLKLHFQERQHRQAKKPVAVEKKIPMPLMLDLEIKSKDDKTPLPSNVNIAGIRKDVLELKNISKFETDISRKNRSAFITASSKGYMLTSVELKTKTNKARIKLEILLEPILKGRKVNLNKIQFFGNRAEFLPTAEGSLLSLLDFMQINETVKIEIEGHVNGPGQRNSKDYKVLSDNRAKAVKSYLVDNGINEDRIKFIGYGNSRMLYPRPKNENQMSANRRVEVKITAK